MHVSRALVFLSSLLLLAALASASTYYVDPRLDRAFAGNDNVSFLVHLKGEDNHARRAVEGLRAHGAVSSHAAWATIGHAVLRSAQENAQASQGDVLEHLQQDAEVSRVKAYYVANSIAVTGTRKALDRLLDRFADKIKAVYTNQPFVSRNVPVPTHREDIIPHALITNPLEDSIQWNIEYVGAPKVWAEFNVTGEGLIYANADTGVDHMHEVLKGSYFGLKSNGEYDHNYAWWDGVKHLMSPDAGDVKCQPDSQVPCDDHGHGSHTLGTTLGAKGFGVAPGAKWMACRNMDRNLGSPETYLGCLQFFLAPTDLKGQNPNPALRPIVIGNSYGCPPQEGCAPGVMHEALANLREAGIFMSVSAGNDGPACSTVNSPPAVEESSFVVAAGSYKSNQVTNFSSRGPVIVHADRTFSKPDITAPGHRITSCVPGNKYDTWSGTSMASPHIGGAVLLITAACKHLERRVADIEALLIKTAIPLTTDEGCGGDKPTQVPNNVFGHGMIDIYKAVSLCAGKP